MKTRIDKRVAAAHLRPARRWGVAMLLSLAALSSCSKPESPDEAPFDGRIRVVAGIPQSRAVTDASTGITGAWFVVKDGNATLPTSFVGAKVYTGNVAATSGEVTFTSTSVPTYNLSDANAWFVAYAPGGALTNRAIEWPIDGKTDIMVTNSAWDAGKYTAPKSTGLNFNHRLAQIEVVCRAESGAAIEVVRSAWGKVLKIEFVGAPTTMKYDLSAVPTISTSGSADLPLLATYNGSVIPATGFDLRENNSTTPNAMAMVAPVAPTTTESFTLRITAAGNGAGEIVVEQKVSLSGSKAPLIAGRKHTVTLAFKADNKAIEVAGTAITPWAQGYTGSGAIEK